MTENTLKVLIVDDNASFRRLVVATLRSLPQCGEILEVEDGREALALLPSFSPSLAIVDWKMKDLDGEAFVRHVRNHSDSPNPTLPIIVVTGHTEVGVVARMRDAGVSDFLAKPFSPHTLLARVVSAVVSPRPFVKTVTYFGPDRRRLQRPFQGTERRVSNLPFS